MASKKPKGAEQKVNKQYILDHLDEKEVDLSMCNLSQVPVKELAMVTRGTRVDLSRNLFTTLPDNFGDLKHLIELDLSSNQLTQLPDSMGQLTLLQKLDLYSNKLTMLPLTFWHLKKLKWLDLRNNTLEAGLLEAAGPCVSEAECKQCAAKVLTFMKQKSSEHERKRQLELQQKKELEKKLAEEEKLKQDEAKRQKNELRQRKRDEYAARLEAERAQLAKQQEQEEEAEFIKNEKAVGEQLKSPVKAKRTSCGSFLSKSFALIILLLLLGSLGLFVYCDYTEGPAQVCSYWKEYVKERWFGQLLKIIGYS